MKTVADRLSTIPDVFWPLREHVQRYQRFGATSDEAGVVSIAPNPKVAPLYFVFRIFPPAHPDWLVRQRSYEVPIEYLRFLSYTNGCLAYGMSLYGFTPLLESDPPLLSRTKLQCHDLTTANEVWIAGFRVPRRLFHFGSRHCSYTENVGFFMEESGNIVSFLKSGRQVQCWTDFTSFLRDELSAAEVYNQPKNPQ